MKVSPKQYARTLIEVTEKTKDHDSVNQSIERFVALVKNNKDQKKMGRIVEEFEKIIKENSGELLVEIESSKELSDEAIANIKNAISKKENVSDEKIKVILKKNPSLIGGIRIKIGNEEIDGSIKSKLARLQLSLT